MTTEEYQQQMRDIQDRLVGLFVGKDKRLSIIVALSIAATTAHQIGMPKLELQTMLMRLYDERIAEAGQQ